MNKVNILNDLLREELKNYYEFLKEKYGYISTVDDLLNIDDISFDDNLDGDNEIILDALNNYINLDYDDNFDLKINNTKYISNSLKTLIMIRIYEYGIYHFDMLLNSEKEIITEMNSNPCYYNVLRLYNNNYHIVLNLYCSLVLDSFDQSDILECKKRIIEDSKLNIITKILPSVILDYRFLLGYKFENEDIKSVKVGKKIINFVDNIVDDNYSLEQMKKLISINMLENEKDASFIENNQKYIISNTYENILYKTNLTIDDINFLQVIEYEGIDAFVQQLFKTDYSLEYLICTFYSLNKNKFNENYLFRLRENTKEKGKIKIIAKINPYYYEESKYFDNKKSSHK